MDGLIHAFGVDIKLIATSIVNFAILAGALGYFLYKPVLRILDEREKAIAQGVKDAADAARLVADADVKYAEVITAAETEASELVLRAKKHADEKGAEIVGDAQDKAAHVAKDAAAKREEIIASAKRESEAEIAKLAVLAAEKLLMAK